ncbi:MAG: hypothetical protein LAP85_13875 [Acidobacteriia bacterium]|nr:hypothetical protein [Terriglobia bacterium]
MSPDRATQKKRVSCIAPTGLLFAIASTRGLRPGLLAAVAPAGLGEDAAVAPAGLGEDAGVASAGLGEDAGVASAGLGEDAGVAPLRGWVKMPGARGWVKVRATGEETIG